MSLDPDDNLPAGFIVSFSLNLAVVQKPIMFGFFGLQYYITALVAVVPI